MRKICVFTGSRAEYGLLTPLMKEIEKDKSLELMLLVTGTHLSPEFGLTYREIKQDGFDMHEKVEMLLSSDTPVGISKSIGLGLIGYSEALERVKPDIAVVLGDRFEAQAFAIACVISGIPLAHIHGGESTEGAMDELFRHAITKMSHLHFTSTEEYRNRVIQMGEDPHRVFNVGALGIDNVKRLKLLGKQELEKDLNISLKSRNLLVTFHSVTLEKNTSSVYFRNVLEALNDLEETNIIFTKSNADTGGRVINEMIDEYVSRNPDKAVAFTSLGQMRYLSLMQFVDAVVGNSSSGIIEAPSFKIATVNIGDRQEGRIKAKSVIDCQPNLSDIKRALAELYSPQFQKKLKEVVNLYGDGNTAEKIAGVLKSFDVSRVLKKKFYDVPFALGDQNAL